MKTKQKISNLVAKVAKLQDELQNEIYEICEESTYKNSSLFSYNIDNLKRFVDYLNESAHRIQSGQIETFKQSTISSYHSKEIERTSNIIEN